MVYCPDDLVTRVHIQVPRKKSGFIIFQGVSPFPGFHSTKTLVLRQKKVVKKGRKKRHLPDSCLQTPAEHRESRKNRQRKRKQPLFEVKTSLGALSKKFAGIELD